ncbi:hypothetical protein RclHR1_02870003 [Rhizophagus clarus]|uniref:Uncharacterized protein n=1 Tax=Rhizophagus clarus TaxID=94130 RepID=A0A2Z6R4E5_9GLOM|nr:hypothetical protein RclHR1_02870003 [Rhizophagus clarus]GES80090.1 hypothetical protein GLOIN_2v1786311 [Rhizophagus clarus]
MSALISSTENFKLMKTIEDWDVVDNIIVNNIIDGDETDNNIIDNNIIDNDKTDVDDNDCLETILSPEQVREMLNEFGFDSEEVKLWNEPIKIPLGVSMSPFVIREVILSGLHFQDIEEYPEIAYECKKGQIPKWVSQKVQSVNPGRLIPGTGTPDRSYPDYISVYRFQKPSKNRDQTKILDPLKINLNNSNQHFLYRGIRTLDIIPVFLLRVALAPSVNNEFGPGIYCTPNFDLAVEYAGRNGAILVFDWSNLDGDFTIKTLTDREWEDTVKGWICVDDDSKPGPPQFDEDIIQGPVSKNHGSIYNCSKPIQSQDLQVVAVTPSGMNAMAERLYAIIYLY